MTRTRLTFKDRDQWLAARREGIGASEVATIVGLNPWETPYQLWRRKVGLDEAKPMSAAMAAGHILEDGVARYWAEATGRQIIQSSRSDFMFVDPEKPFLRVSPDRTYWLEGEPRNDDNKGILECKTTRMVVDPADLPKHWFAQVQMNLGVAGYTSGSLAWLSAAGGFDFGYQDIKLVPDFFGWLAEETERFWTDCVQGGAEPSAESVKDVLLKYAVHAPGKVVEADEDLLKLCGDIKAVRAEMDALAARKEELEARLKTAFGDAEAIARGGETLATFKAPKAGTKFDAKAFQAEHPDLAARYSKPSQGARRLLLK